MKVLRLIPVLLMTVTMPLLTAQTKPAAKPVTKAATAPTPAATGTKDPLDINTASPDQLMALPGVGTAYAQRIINGRPYTAKNQLVSRGILPQATYDKISGVIVARRVNVKK